MEEEPLTFADGQVVTEISVSVSVGFEVIIDGYTEFCLNGI
jgi:hypothetical protein